MSRNMKLRKMILFAVLIALSAVLAYVKIPIPPIATLAFDSLPGFVAAALINPIAGGIIGAIGHFFTALYSGFPLGILSHGIIMGTMFITMLVFGLLYRNGMKTLAAIAAVLLNGPLSLVPFIFILGWGVVAGMIIPLTIAAFVNVVLAMAIIPMVKKAVSLDE